MKPNFDKSLNFDETDNIIIEGDNLEVLKILQKSYHKSIDIIYIDPPYNTGNDFIYNDNFYESKDEYLKSTNQIDVDGNKLTSNLKSSGRFHSKWLSMIYPRLLISRTLLKDEGMIFISIDDNEYAKLKMICDEIFGENNFISSIIWRKKNTGGGSDKVSIDNETEYILLYQKNHEKNIINSRPIESNDFKYSDEYFDIRGRYNLTDLDRVSSKTTFQYSESLDYEIVAPDGTKFKNYRNILKPKSYRYTLSKKTFDFYNENGFIEFSKNKDGYWRAYRKSYEKVTIDRKKLEIIERVNGKNYNNLINDGKITTSQGKKELISLIEDKDFSFPKPTQLLKYLVNLNKNKNSIVLDFFAGSGSTGQAVMELNKDDGGDRKYILVQLDEKIKNDKFNSISEILVERIKKSINSFNYKEKGYKFFEIIDSNISSKNITLNNDFDQLSFDDFYQKNNEYKIYDEINLVYEIFLKDGIKLTTKLVKIIEDNNYLYIDENNSLIFMLNNSSLSFLKKQIEKVWKENNYCGVLKIFLKDDLLTDNTKLNIFEFVAQINKSNNNIHIISI